MCVSEVGGLDTDIDSNSIQGGLRGFGGGVSCFGGGVRGELGRVYGWGVGWGFYFVLT